MGDCVDFGIISNVEFGKDYSNIGSPSNYKTIYELYQCVSIPDDIVSEWISLTQDIPTYLGSLSNPFMGIDHYGVTLIPPESIQRFIVIVEKYIDCPSPLSISMLTNLLKLALEQSYYIICYGI